MIHLNNLPAGLGGQEVIRKWLSTLGESHGCTLNELSYNYISDEAMLQLNQRHLGHDYVTDIITFEYKGRPRIEGEVFIAPEQVKRQAVDYRTRTAHEMLRVTAHGLLHLVGFKDHTEQERKEMRSEEEKALILHAQISGNEQIE